MSRPDSYAKSKVCRFEKELTQQLHYSNSIRE